MVPTTLANSNKLVFFFAGISLVILIESRLGPIIGDRVFLLLFPVTLMCCMNGGFRLGLATTTFSTVCAWYFLMPPVNSMKIPDESSLFGLAVFQMTGVLFSIYGQKLLSSQQVALVSSLALEQAREAAEDANRAKTQFLANMSHEIRTPLGIIMGFSELALVPNQSPIQMQNYLSGIRRNAQQLLQLIGDFLDLAKIEAKKMEVEHAVFSLDQFLQEVIASLKIRAQEKGLALTLHAEGPMPEMIKTDPTRLRQVLVNLIGNAMKFTERGHVKVTVRMILDGTLGAPVQMEIAVEDTGIGLSPAQQEKLFTPFSQADSSMTRKFGGTGLGLALSRQIVEALGGRLQLVESQLNKGSRFAFTFSAGAENPGGVKIGLGTAAPGVNMNPTIMVGDALTGMDVLVVEDSTDNQILIGRYLKGAGATVEFADNGIEGVKKAGVKEYDVVLMDLQMPLMDGQEATRMLRTNGYHGPIVAITAHAMKEERERALSSGFNGYLTKPLSRQTLVDSLKSLNSPTFN
jgi:two-component system, sensor histidine kinase